MQGGMSRGEQRDACAVGISAWPASVMVTTHNVKLPALNGLGNSRAQPALARQV